MLKNHLLVALRGLRRRRGFAALHVAGLAVGLACCFLVLLYVQDELGFDRVHTHADRIFRLGEERTFGGRTVQLVSTPVGVADALRTAVPVVEAVVQMTAQAGLLRRPEADESLAEDRVLFADASLFEVFTFPLVAGDAATALAEPGAVVLTESVARRLFGAEAPLGQTVLLERLGYGVQDPEPIALTVTAVAADPPANSTVRFGVAVAGRTLVHDFGGARPRLSGSAETFVLTRTARDREALVRALEALSAEDPHSFGAYAGALVDPLRSLHFAYQRPGGGFTGQWRYVYLFSAVALLVLLIAAINYMNLATAHAATRAKEVGVRKTLGAGRGELARQFVTEALLMAALAGALAAGLAAAALPAFNRLFGKAVAVALPEDGALVLGMGALTALVGLLAGSYPAVVLSRFQPASALKGERAHGRGGARLRQALVVVQFTLTVGLLAATGVVAEQLRYAQRLSLGFRGDQVLTLDMSARGLGRQGAAVKAALGAVPGVRRATLSSAVPGDFKMLTGAAPVAEDGEPAAEVPLYFAHADAAWTAAYGLELAAGRYFREGDTDGVVLNEAAARALGLMTTDPAAAVGRRVHLGAEQEVVGVLRDFHFSSARDEIGPVAVMPLGDVYNSLTLTLQLHRADVPGTLAALERAWTRLAPFYPFTYRFVDDQFDALYRTDRQLAQIFGVFAGLAVVLAGLGLFGLAAYAAERRTKELGIRKVLGASAASLVALLSREFLALVLVAFVLAVPGAYYLMSRWLEDFTYRIDLGPGVFLAAGGLALAVALATVAGQAFRAATADPVKALRYE